MCVVTSITILIFNIQPILNIQFHYWASCEYNWTKFVGKSFFNIVMPYRTLWILFWGFVQNSISLLLLEKAIHFSDLLLWIHRFNPCTYLELMLNLPKNNYIQEKNYKLLVFNMIIIISYSYRGYYNFLH